MKINDFFKADGHTLDWERIEKIPEFAKMATTKQSPIWHREGNVLTHTKLVCKHMSEIMSDEVGSLNYRIMMVAAACHDLGKPDTTYFDERDREYHCKNHGDRGDKITRELLAEENTALREKVCYIVRHHMVLHHILSKDEKGIERKLIEMSWGWVTVNDMLRMKMADSRGSLNDVETEEAILDTVSTIKSKAMLLGCLFEPYKFSSHAAKRHFFCRGELADIEEGETPPINMYVMVGLPGSGKNFAIDHLLADDVVRISRDDIRTEMGLEGEKPQGDAQQESEVTKIFNRRVKDACGNGQDFVSNNVNVRLRYRKELMNLTLPTNVIVTYIVIDTPIGVCKERREGMIPPNVIDRMSGYTDFPTPLEFDTALVVRNGNIEQLSAPEKIYYNVEER